MDQVSAEDRKPLIFILSAFLFSTIATSSTNGSSLPSLRYLLIKGTEGVEWKSVKHQHDYSNPDLELAVKTIIDELIRGNLETDLQSLSSLEREQLSFDSLDSRTDLIDLLSIELKLRLEEEWKQKIGATIAFDSSELWSLSKYRLKKLLVPELPLTSGITIFRAPGMTSTEVVLGCAEPKGLQMLPQPKQSLELKVGGVHLSRQDFSNRPQVDVLCGTRRFQFQVKTEITPATWKPQKPLEIFRDHASLEILGSVGLTASVSPTTYELMKKMIQWRGSFKLISEEEVDLKSQYSSLMASADLLNMAADIPNGNQFRMSLQAERGNKIRFQKTLEGAGKLTTLNLIILSPPIRSPERLERLKKEQGVSFSFDEISKIFQARKKPVALIDLTCFSTKHLKNWLPPVIEAGQKTAWLMGSHRGQAGETLLDVLPQLDLMLSIYDSVLKGSTLDELEALLSAGTFVGHSMSAAFQVLNWLGLQKTFNPSYLPVSNFDKSFLELNEAKIRKVIFLKEISTGSLRRYNPTTSL